jgi:cytoskeletal protein CcmA (bactofilin family)
MMFNRRDPKPEETMSVPTMSVSNVNSHAEKTPEAPQQTPSNAQIANYAGPSEVHAHRPAPASQSQYEGHVLIGEGVKIKGEIRDCREIEIHGTVEGDLEAEVLIVHGKGVVTGTVKTDRAEVHGSIDGDISVKYLLAVKAKGSVAGKTTYGELSVETGGRVVGTLDEQSTKKDNPEGATSHHRPTTDPILKGNKTATSNPTQRAPALA